MRKMSYWAAIAAFAFIAAGGSSPAARAQASSSTSAQTISAQTTAASDAAPQDPLAAAARKAKEQKKETAAKPAKVFTNENLPGGTISTVGIVPTVGTAAVASTSASAESSSGAKSEAIWRDKFDQLHQKLDRDQADLAVMQRELGVLNLQGYSDPNKAMEQSYSRSDITKKTEDIEAKKKDIAADQQAIDDAQTDMQRAGGNPGWAR